MNTRIKILILEHSSNDPGLLQGELEKSNLNYCLEVVHTKEDYGKVLTKFQPDIIIVDYPLPSVNELSAFRIRQKVAPDTPFIILSGTIGEENVVELIRNNSARWWIFLWT